MQNQVLVRVSPEVGAKLDQLAVLAGSPSAAIERLIEHWEGTRALGVPPAVPNETPKAAVWVTPSGDALPVGASLEGRYRAKAYRALVDSSGIRYAGSIYASPSAAAKAVKTSLGVTGTAANTDGRDFWKLRDPITGRLVAIKDLVPRDPIDTQKILEDLRAKGRAARKSAT